jgi:hypothetical protein
MTCSFDDNQIAYTGQTSHYNESITRRQAFRLDMPPTQTIPSRMTRRLLLLQIHGRLYAGHVKQLFSRKFLFWSGQTWNSGLSKLCVNFNSVFSLSQARVTRFFGQDCSKNDDSSSATTVCTNSLPPSFLSVSYHGSTRLFSSTLP